MSSRKHRKLADPVHDDARASQQHSLGQYQQWDDAELLDSWEETLQEYKRYHSLHARGIAPEEALRAYDAAIAHGADEAAAVAAVFGSGDLPLCADAPLADDDDYGSAAMDEDDGDGDDDHGNSDDNSSDEQGNIHSPRARAPPKAPTPSHEKRTAANAATKRATGPSHDTTADASELKQDQSTQQPLLPGPLVSGVQDEAVKNGFMAWYYAGYYTGLHEGEQRAYARMQAEQQQ